jgi:hypothetical protein
MSTSCRRTVAAAGLLALALLTGCGSDEGSAGDSETDVTQPTQTPTSEPTTTEPSTEPTESTDDGSGAGIQGDGYSYAVPDGWQDATALAKQQSPQADTAIAIASASDFANNINILSPTPYTGDETTLLTQAKQELKSLTSSPVRSIEPVDFDGTTAQGQQSTGDSASGPLTFTQYLVIKDGQLRVVTLTSALDEQAASAAALDKVVDSWRWTTT